MAHPFEKFKESEHSREKGRTRADCRARGGMVATEISRARGGGIPMKGGAETGQGRLDKAKAYNAKG